MTIKAIDSGSIHRLTSGQVILDLQTAVKELVENGLDAGATSIEVRFKNYGLDGIECIDNGHGISPEDYESIALKYYTSKLEKFTDLENVASFGFRGEALSSLTALADVSIVTCTKSQEPKGVTLEFERSGKLKPTRAVVARQRGTTVHIANIFKSLPVRRRDLEKHIKREFNKAHSLLTAYALISVGVKFAVYNQPLNGKRSEVLKTEGAASIRTHYGSIFGVKTLQTMVPLDLTLEVNAENNVLKQIGREKFISKIPVNGIISKPVFGNGRASTDRQYFFVNGRPFNTTKISKAFNESFRSILPTQYPCIVANFQIPASSYDVNVSPDKRTIFLHSEANLIEDLKKCLDEYLQSFQSSIPSTESRTATAATSSSSSKANEKSYKQSLLSLEKDPSGPDDEISSNQEDSQPSLLPKSSTHDNSSTRQNTPLSGASSPRQVQDESLPPTKRRKLIREHEESDNDNDDDTQSIDSDQIDDNSPPPQPTRDIVLDTTLASWSPSQQRRLENKTSSSSLSKSHSVISTSTSTAPANKIPTISILSDHQETSSSSIDVQRHLTQPENAREPSPSGDEIDQEEDNGDDEIEILSGKEPVDSKAPESEEGNESINVAHSLLARETESKSLRQEFTPLHDIDALNQVYSFDMNRLSQRWKNMLLYSERHEQELDKEKKSENDLQGASVACDNSLAESVLTRIISQEDFAQMEILGQFNLGFIIARRRKNVPSDGTEQDDLFIIDQHASDEKFNFEKLQETTEIQSQQLITPRVLHLTAPDELVAFEHTEALKLNGFEIKIDENAPVGKRVSLVAHPISKNTKFDVQDFDELLHALRDLAPGKIVRCKKVRSMFAMRACRMSVMIGKALTMNQMNTIVKHMGTMHQPWSCPHGRPTMRLLSSLKPPEPDKRFSNISWEKLANTSI